MILFLSIMFQVSNVVVGFNVNNIIDSVLFNNSFHNNKPDVLYQFDFNNIDHLLSCHSIKFIDCLIVGRLLEEKSMHELYDNKKKLILWQSNSFSSDQHNILAIKQLLLQPNLSSILIYLYVYQGWTPQLSSTINWWKENHEKNKR